MTARMCSFCIVIFLTVFSLSLLAAPARLAIVIDDFGYRKYDEEKVLRLPAAISVAVLPDSPMAQQMANKAHQTGHEVLIHMPMAPFGEQNLEHNTLQPTMNKTQLRQIIAQAIRNVPHAKGMNNHMGSAMTSDFAAMQNVMQILQHYKLYFLDSRTIATTQVPESAEGTRVKVLIRNVFLDDDQRESAVHEQFDRAIGIARKQGFAIAIGHPYSTTVRVLQQRLPQLPPDIVLVPVSDLLPVSQSQPFIAKFLPGMTNKAKQPLKFARVCPARSTLANLNHPIISTTLTNKFSSSPAIWSAYAYLAYCNASLPALPSPP